VLLLRGETGSALLDFFVFAVLFDCSRFSSSISALFGATAAAAAAAAVVDSERSPGMITCLGAPRFASQTNPISFNLSIRSFDKRDGFPFCNSLYSWRYSV